MIILSNTRMTGKGTNSSIAFKKAHHGSRSIWISTDLCDQLKVQTKQFAAMISTKITYVSSR